MYGDKKDYVCEEFARRRGVIGEKRDCIREY